MSEVKADKVTPRLAKAMAWVIEHFGQDSRKQSRVPVLSHLFNVCALVQYDGGSEDEAIAGLLHDLLEDKPQAASAAEIEEHFGERVRELVELATDTPPGYGGGAKPRWRERKEAYLRHLRAAKSEDLRITMADKLDNVRAMVADYRREKEGLWERFNAGRDDQLWYFREVVLACRSRNPQTALLDDLETEVEKLHRLVGVPWTPAASEAGDQRHPG